MALSQQFLFRLYLQYGKLFKAAAELMAGILDATINMKDKLPVQRSVFYGHFPCIHDG